MLLRTFFSKTAIFPNANTLAKTGFKQRLMVRMSISLVFLLVLSCDDWNDFPAQYPESKRHFPEHLLQSVYSSCRQSCDTVMTMNRPFTWFICSQQSRNGFPGGTITVCLFGISIADWPFRAA